MESTKDKVVRISNYDSQKEKSGSEVSQARCSKVKVRGRFFGGNSVQLKTLELVSSSENLREEKNLLIILTKGKGQPFFKRPFKIVGCHAASKALLYV